MSGGYCGYSRRKNTGERERGSNDRDIQIKLEQNSDMINITKGGKGESHGKARPDGYRIPELGKVGHRGDSQLPVEDFLYVAVEVVKVEGNLVTESETLLELLYV